MLPLLLGAWFGFPGRFSAIHPPEADNETCTEKLSAIRAFVPTLDPRGPIFAAFHNGQVQNPLGGGSYAFQHGIIRPVLSALVDDEVLAETQSAAQQEGMGSRDRPTRVGGKPSDANIQTRRLPTRPIVIHAGLQPNNSPHAGHPSHLLLRLRLCPRGLQLHGSDSPVMARIAASHRQFPSRSPTSTRHPLPGKASR